MSDKDREGVNRRKFLGFAGTAAATAMAGCGGGGDTDTATDTESGMGDTDTPTPSGGDETPTDRPEPTTRDGYLQRANRHANEQAPWVFLNRQYSVYGKSADIEWQARADEFIDAYAISPATDSGDDVVINQSQMDSGLDPQDHRATPTDNVVMQAYEKLLDRDLEGGIVDSLADDYSRQEDGRVRFQIRDGVSFHSGDNLTPEDVAFSINRIVDPDVGGLASPQQDQLAGVTGAEVVDGERAVDVMSDGLNPILFSLFASYGPIVNKSWIQSNDSSYINQNIDGTGPFLLETYEQNVQVVFNRNDNYWRDAAEISSLTITSASESSTRVNSLLSDEADIIVNVPPQEVSRVEENDGTSIAAAPSTRVIFNAMRYDVEPFDSPEFRQAINYAIDLESIIQNVLSTFGDATGQPTLDGFFGYNSDTDPYPYDPDEAEALVEASGYAGAEITLETPVGRYLNDVEIAQAVASYVDDLPNVTASVEQRDFQTLAGEVTDGNIESSPHWYLLGWGNTTFDASQTIIPLLTSGGNLTSYSNDEFDRLVEEAQSLPSEQ
ncbi:ABC transporter substrate-binding protein [Halolamina salifodinae]|uniref:Peptide/nickel transport system substrate-binding protein n=1 Tax=Halolamina salifodinae TaxID=1202767 RepID=A0A8T4GTL2_9EURY|nr:ABC transporter substrate-binding protein [Halolamina salifodinae]MBP1985740.1 peptide/nickel transport system substrate-binding protein [Halolamina salifodinae]